jgi:hypothetical protein
MTLASIVEFSNQKKAPFDSAFLDGNPLYLSCTSHANGVTVLRLPDHCARQSLACLRIGLRWSARGTGLKYRCQRQVFFF